MTKKQQTKIKRQFSYLKKQFKEAGIDVSEMKFTDLKQKSYKTLNRMRAELLKTTKIFGDKEIKITRNDKLLIGGDIFKLELMTEDEFGRKKGSLIKKEDEFYSYRRVYDEEGVRVDDYSLSVFYELYSPIWDDENAGFYLSELVRGALLDPYGVEGEFLTQDLRITDYKFYTFEEWK